MKMRTAMPSKQGGFSILTGFVLAIVMFGTLGFFLASQGINSTFGTSYSNISKVSGLLTSAGYIKTGFDAIVLSGQLPSAVTFNAAPTTGVFNPTSGGTAQQTLDPTLFESPTSIDGYWVYRSKDITMKGIGVPANADYTMLVSGLKLTVCQQINNILNGTSLSATPLTITGQADAAVIGAPTLAAPSVTGITLDLTDAAITGLNSINAVNGWASGCFKTTDNHYVYIHTLLAQ